MSLSPKFQNIVFPGKSAQRRPLDLAVVETPVIAVQAETRLPGDQWAFVEWLFQRAGLNASAYRPETLARRLPACMRVVRSNSLFEARRLLELSPGLLPAAMSAMLVGVTQFFRDPAVFELLRAEFIPALIMPRGGLYAWSAGCSGGEELYSLAFLLKDMGALHASYLLGTDCRLEAIAQAKEGEYSQEAMGNVTPQVRARFFEPRGNRWQVAKRIRGTIRWRAANLLAMREPGLWDLILFRNTSIYLRTRSARELWGQLEASLRYGGVLVLGKAERPIAACRLQQVGPCIYRRTRR